MLYLKTVFWRQMNMVNAISTDPEIVDFSISNHVRLFIGKNLDNAKEERNQQLHKTKLKISRIIKIGLLCQLLFHTITHL